MKPCQLLSPSAAAHALGISMKAGELKCGECFTGKEGAKAEPCCIEECGPYVFLGVSTHVATSPLLCDRRRDLVNH